MLRISRLISMRRRVSEARSRAGTPSSSWAAIWSRIAKSRDFSLPEAAQLPRRQRRRKRRRATWPLRTTVPKAVPMPTAAGAVVAEEEPEAQAEVVVVRAAT
jgi:hypothetical protein